MRRLFFVLLTNVCSTTEDIPNEVIFPQNNSSQWIHPYKSPELMKCNESGSHMNSTCVHFSTSIFFHVSQPCTEILFSEWVETVTGYQLVGNKYINVVNVLITYQLNVVLVKGLFC